MKISTWLSMKVLNFYDESNFLVFSRMKISSLFWIFLTFGPYLNRWKCYIKLTREIMLCKKFDVSSWSMNSMLCPNISSQTAALFKKVFATYSALKLMLFDKIRVCESNYYISKSLYESVWKFIYIVWKKKVRGKWACILRDLLGLNYQFFRAAAFITNIAYPFNLYCFS